METTVSILTNCQLEKLSLIEDRGHVDCITAFRRPHPCTEIRRCWPQPCHASRVARKLNCNRNT